MKRKIVAAKPAPPVFTASADLTTGGVTFKGKVLDLGSLARRLVPDCDSHAEAMRRVKAMVYQHTSLRPADWDAMPENERIDVLQQLDKTLNTKSRTTNGRALGGTPTRRPTEPPPENVVSVWCRRARESLERTDDLVFTRLITQAVLTAARIVTTKSFAEKQRPLRTVQDLRFWCQLQLSSVAGLDQHAAQFPDARMFMLTAAENTFLGDVNALVTHLEAGNVNAAKTIADCYQGDLNELSAIDEQTARDESPAAKIRRVGWDLMRSVPGSFRPDEPQDEPTWNTVRRDLDTIVRWCDAQGSPNVAPAKSPNAVDLAADINPADYSQRMKPAEWCEVLKENGVPISKKTLSRRCFGDEREKIYELHPGSTNRRISIKLSTLPPPVAAALRGLQSGHKIDSN